VHLVGFIIEIYHDAWPSECQISGCPFSNILPSAPRSIKCFVFTFSSYNFKSRHMLVSTASMLRFGQSGVEISVGKSDLFKTPRPNLRTHPASYSVGFGVFPGGTAAGACS